MVLKVMGVDRVIDEITQIDWAAWKGIPD